MHVYQHIHISYTHMFPLGYVHVFIFFQKFAPRPRKHPLKPLILKNLLLQESGLSKGAILALNSDTLKMERQKLLRAQDPGWHGRVRHGWTVDLMAWEGLWVLVELNAPWKIAGNWKELAKECLAMRVEPVETWRSWHFLLRNGGVNSSCLVKLSCDVFFFLLVLMHKKGVNTGAI